MTIVLHDDDIPTVVEGPQSQHWSISDDAYPSQPSSQSEAMGYGLHNHTMHFPNMCVASLDFKASCCKRHCWPTFIALTESLDKWFEPRQALRQDEVRFLKQKKMWNVMRGNLLFSMRDT